MRKVWARLRWQGVRMSKARVLRLMRAAHLLAPSCLTRRNGVAIATGLRARHDHGSQYMSDYFQAELKFLGIEASPAFVREPEGNGVAERFIRTLKEQLLWVRTFETVEELRVALLEFKERYREWLCERHGPQTPLAVRAQASRRKAA